MKYSLVIVVLVFLSSASQAKQYSWNFMDVGYSEDGLGSGPSYTVSSGLMSNLFARAPFIRHQQQTDTKPINSLFSFYTAGYQYRLLFFEAGVSQYDICWYACADYTGNIVMGGWLEVPTALKSSLVLVDWISWIKNGHFLKLMPVPPLIKK